MKYIKNRELRDCQCSRIDANITDKILPQEQMIKLAYFDDVHLVFIAVNKLKADKTQNIFSVDLFLYQVFCWYLF